MGEKENSSVIKFDTKTKIIPDRKTNNIRKSDGLRLRFSVADEQIFSQPPRWNDRVSYDQPLPLSSSSSSSSSSLSRTSHISNPQSFSYLPKNIIQKEKTLQNPTRINDQKMPTRILSRPPQNLRISTTKKKSS